MDDKYPYPPPPSSTPTTTSHGTVAILAQGTCRGDALAQPFWIFRVGSIPGGASILQTFWDPFHRKSHLGVGCFYLHFDQKIGKKK